MKCSGSFLSTDIVNIKKYIFCIDKLIHMMYNINVDADVAQSVAQRLGKA